MFAVVCCLTPVGCRTEYPLLRPIGTHRFPVQKSAYCISDIMLCIKHERFIIEGSGDEHFHSSADVTGSFLELHYTLSVTGIPFWPEVRALLSTDMRRLTKRIRSEKCVVREFRLCHRVYLHQPR
jgi:hypothetical protein